jgi:zinc transport system ATP-binding protein
MNETHPLAQLKKMLKAPMDYLPAVELQNISVYRGRNLVLHGIDLCVEAGSFLGIIGPNGGGKTTLLNVILGNITPSDGTIEVFGGNPRRQDRRRQTIGYVPQYQTIPDYFPASVYDVVLMGAYGAAARCLPVKREYKDQARYLLSQVKLDHLMNRPIGKLSGGQQQRVLIARALVTRPRLLLLDEPLRGVDFSGQSKFHELIIELKNQLDLTVIMVSHDIHQLARLSDRIACLNKSIHWHDHPERISPEILTEVYRCEWEALLTQSGIDADSPQPPDESSAEYEIYTDDSE